MGENKQVFLYFSNLSVPPSEFDAEQYEEIKEFQKKSVDKGLYHGYDDLEEFRKDFTNHLNLHFLKIINESDPLVTSSKIPDLNIKGVYNGKLIDNPVRIQRKLKESQFIENLSLEIESLFNSIKNSKLKLSIVIDHDIKDNNETKIKSRIPDLNINVKGMQALLGKEEMKISDVGKKLINKHAAINDLTLEDATFFNVGNLNKTKNMLGGASYRTGPSYQLNGTDEEKKIQTNL